MPDLNVTLVQTDPVWESITANLEKLDTRLAEIRTPTDLVILPEMFSTGFSMNAPALAETMAGGTVRWMRRKAAELGVHLAGSAIITEKGRFYNRLIWARPDGPAAVYDKRHPYSYAGENRVYAAGTRHLTVELKGWRIRPFICYDLRFPIWCRNIDLVYDLAIFVASWPTPRAAHWKALLKARAIENQACVIGVNRVGRDGNGLDYSGDSTAIDARGVVLFEKAVTEWTETITLERSALDAYRSEYPFWKDADRSGW